VATGWPAPSETHRYSTNQWKQKYNTGHRKIRTRAGTLCGIARSTCLDSSTVDSDSECRRRRYWPGALTPAIAERTTLWTLTGFGTSLF
jgi:hypothetical protein